MIGYITSPERQQDLAQELARAPDAKVIQQIGSLFILNQPLQIAPIFSHAIWHQPQQFSFPSIGEAAKILKSQGKLWSCSTPHFHRRANLITEQLLKLKPTPLAHFDPKKPTLPTKSLGAWTLADENTLWLSPTTSSPYPDGICQFQETKEAPSRAYLKLWEFFCKEQICPQPHEKCIDLGACPGGWSWVLAQTGAQVIAVDKAPLDPKVTALRNVQTLKKDAFILKPEDIGPVDWLFSDIICYPPKLLELVQQWLATGQVKNFVCTIKFQGQTDFTTMDAFLKIPGSKIQHLSVNKHEVTWSLIGARS